MNAHTSEWQAGFNAGRESVIDLMEQALALSSSTSSHGHAQVAFFNRVMGMLESQSTEYFGHTATAESELAKSLKDCIAQIKALCSADDVPDGAEAALKKAGLL